MGKGKFTKERKNGKITHVYCKCHILYLMVIPKEILKLVKNEEVHSFQIVFNSKIPVFSP